MKILIVEIKQELLSRISIESKCLYCVL